MKKIFLIFLYLILLINCAKQMINIQGGKNMIPADDPDINYYGRIDFSNPKEPRFDWPGIAIEANFDGTSISMILQDNDNNYNIFIDGKLHKIIAAEKGLKTYELASGLKDTKHKILITKRTEGMYGIAKFLGFILDNNKKLLPAPEKPKYKFEFIGDSLTCGYGNEGTSKQCSDADLRATENNYLSYAQEVARKLNAEAHLIAISGKGIVRNYGDKEKISKDPLPSFYDFTLQNDPSKKWDFKKWVPDMVFINLGTNDFSTEPNPDKDIFIAEYKKLINKIRNNYGKNIKILCLCPPFEQNKLRNIISQIAKEEKTDFFELPELSEDEKNGCHWHPTVKGHEKMASALIKKIKKFFK